MSIKEIILPQNCVAMEKEEMQYIDGGGASLRNSASYLSRSYCLATAQGLINSRAVTGMSKTDIAKEIFAHAIGLFAGAMLKQWGINNGKTAELLDRSSYIDIDDGGDTLKRQVAYNAIWYHSYGYSQFT